MPGLEGEDEIIGVDVEEKEDIRKGVKWERNIGNVWEGEGGKKDFECTIFDRPQGEVDKRAERLLCYCI